MRTLRYLLISCLFTLGIFSLVTYTACTKDKCKADTCFYHGTCNNGICTCTTGYEGVNCEKDLCDDKVCLNGGMCTNGTCQCPAGYEGDNCEIPNKFLGTYSATDECTAVNSSYTVGITMKGNGEMVLRLDHFGNYNGSAYGIISSSGNSFTITGSTYEGYPFNGSGIYNNANGNIEVGYTVSFPGGVISCIGIWVKSN